MKSLFLITPLLVTAIISQAQKNDNAVKNYYHLPENLVYDKVNYHLVASYNPNVNYYKQEYIPEGESPDHYNNMFIIDFYITDQSPKWMAGLKTKELTERKKTDTLAKFDLMQFSTVDECILDFTLSASNARTVSVVERNVYRYRYLTEKSGRKGVVLFAISRRAYSDDIPEFLINLKGRFRAKDDIGIAEYAVPDIDLRN